MSILLLVCPDNDLFALVQDRRVLRYFFILNMWTFQVRQTPDRVLRMSRVYVLPYPSTTIARSQPLLTVLPTVTLASRARNTAPGPIGKVRVSKYPPRSYGLCAVYAQVPLQRRWRVPCNSSALLEEFTKNNADAAEWQLVLH